MNPIPRQLPHENTDAYQAFTAYCKQQGKRSAEKLSHPLGIPKRTLFDWQQKYAWKARAAQFDNPDQVIHDEETVPESLEELSARMVETLYEDYKLHRSLRKEMEAEIRLEVAYFMNEARGFEQKQKIYLKIDSLLNRMNLNTQRFCKRLMAAQKQAESIKRASLPKSEKVRKNAIKRQHLTESERLVMRRWIEAWAEGDKEVREGILWFRNNVVNNPAIDMEAEIEALQLTPEQMEVMRQILAA